MHYGKLVTVVDDGIIMTDKELEPIGVHNETVSWGLWLSDWQLKKPKRTQSYSVPTYDHLVMSPFQPCFWPVLFRVELRLDHELGTLARATKVLKDEGLNILAITLTETGYHHVTVTVIGESQELRNSKQVEFVRTYPAKDKHLWDTKLRKYIHNNFAPLTLSFVRNLRTALYQEHKNSPFLRNMFVNSNDYKEFGEPLPKKKTEYPGSAIMYDPLALPQEWQDEGENQRTKAVRCNWLQNLAFFWSFGDHSEKPIEFRYFGQENIIRPAVGTSENGFKNKLTEFPKPFRTIASINTFERYVRYMFSNLDVEGRTVRVRIPYFSQYQNPDVTSRGFQNEIYTRLAKLKLNLRHLSLRKTSVKSDGESGTLTLLMSTEGAGNRETVAERIKQTVDQSVDEFRNCKMQHGLITVEPLTAKKLFLSGRMEWLTEPNRQSKFRDLARKHGFSLVIGSDEFLKGRPMTPGVVNLIRASHAFVQIFPANLDWDKERMQWMIFELAAAYCVLIPRAVCVPVDRNVDLEKWRARLRIGSDDYLVSYGAELSDTEFFEKIGQEIYKLARRL